MGLDIAGGTHLVYQADLSQKDSSLSDEEVMEALINKIKRRVDSYGTTEPVIQKLGSDRIMVDIPGITNVDEAVKLIGSVAILEIMETRTDASGSTITNDDGTTKWFPAMAIGSDGKTSEALTGKYLLPESKVVVNSTTNEPAVSFKWNKEGAKMFEEITDRNVNKLIAIFLDGELITAATVKEKLSENGTITGMNAQECFNLAIQLNSGSLDVPLINQTSTYISPSLGSDALTKSLIASAIGIVLIIAFMIFYYGMPGVVSSIALIMYGALVLAIYKLVPITLTLPGIAGFVISMGMAIDANILIFERLREELNRGQRFSNAMQEAFRRAWPAIRDSNISTFITCAILYWFGGAFGASMVRSFALTLFIGVAVSMFSAVFITRTLLHLLFNDSYTKSLPVREVNKNV